MRILAIDMGKFKSVFVNHHAADRDGDSAGAVDESGKVETTPAAFHDLLVARLPDRLLVEAGPAAGWVCDLAEALGVAVQVANTNDERWHWKRVKKTDRAGRGQAGPPLRAGVPADGHVPTARVRQWRSFIEYRHALVGRRTAVKNSVRAIFERQGLRVPAAEKAWTVAGLAQTAAEARGTDVAAQELWRFQLHVELQLLAGLQTQVDAVEAKLGELAAADGRVKLLRTAPYVGPRLGEAVVAVLDDPARFRTAKQVASYAGLTPRRWQSGESDRSGHISRAGNRLLRSLLVEIAWLGVRGGTWMARVYENVRRGGEGRKKVAIVAVARRLLVRLWAMMRDGRPWSEAAAGAAPA